MKGHKKGGASPGRQGEVPLAPRKNEAGDSSVSATRGGRGAAEQGVPPAPGKHGAGEPSVPPAPNASPGNSQAATEAPPDYKDKWLRAEAELQNFRRRAQRDLEEAQRYAEERGLLETIEQLDDLERALEVAQEAGAPDPWVQGVQLVANRMRDYLAREGVMPLQPLGERFDPQSHEALLEVDPSGSVAVGEVVQVVRKGYRKGDRVLRPARVVVAGRPKAGEE